MQPVVDYRSTPVMSAGCRCLSLFCRLKLQGSPPNVHLQKGQAKHALAIHLSAHSVHLCPRTPSIGHRRSSVGKTLGLSLTVVDRLQWTAQVKSVAASSGRHAEHSALFVGRSDGSCCPHDHHDHGPVRGDHPKKKKKSQPRQRSAFLIEVDSLSSDQMWTSTSQHQYCFPVVVLFATRNVSPESQDVTQAVWTPTRLSFAIGRRSPLMSACVSFLLLCSSATIAEVSCQGLRISSESLLWKDQIQARSQGVRKGGYILRGSGELPQKIFKFKVANTPKFNDCLRLPKKFWISKYLLLMTEIPDLLQAAFPETVFNALKTWNTWVLFVVVL